MNSSTDSQKSTQGSGSFGKVYLAVRKQDNLQCVLKVVPLRELPREQREFALNEVNYTKKGCRR